MKICPTCNAQLDDNATFCPACGAQFVAPGAAAPQQAYAPADPFDHTAEYDPKDISDNKVFAMLPYLMGVIGIIIALLASHSSRYTMFHIRQALKITVTEILLAVCMALLAWTFIVPIAGAIMYMILFVIQIICFFQVCGGKAKEPAIIRGLGFLK